MVRTLVGTRIRERRRSAGLTQVALARAAGISASYLNLIEHNKRGIAGRTLLALARELGLDVADLTEAADEATITRLLETARDNAEAGAEVDRIEEFLGRYPGWARLATRMADTSRTQAQRLHALSDRMAQDPFLSETMHQILTNITAIRSTAGILSGGDVPSDLQARFLSNLSKDSERMSETVQSMVEFFDADDAYTDPDNTDDTTAWPESPEAAGDPGPQSSAVRENIARRMADAARDMPMDDFVAQAHKTGFDPLALAAEFGVTPDLVLIRLAQLPKEEGLPVFGLVECDMSGAILMRKAIAALNPPQYSSACPLWPLYRSLMRPGQMLRAVLDLPSGDRLMSYAIASVSTPSGYDLPPTLRALMVFSADAGVFPAARDIRQPVLAGLHCSVCPRKGCAERRTDYILA